MSPLWFWELPHQAMGVWAPLYCGFPDYAHGALHWPRREKPVGWVRIR